jgi:hypothetical protein
MSNELATCIFMFDLSYQPGSGRRLNPDKS